MVSKIVGGRVPGGASECPAAMPSVGTSLGTRTSHRTLSKDLGIYREYNCQLIAAAVVMSELAAICHVLGTLHIHMSHACMHGVAAQSGFLPENNTWVCSKL
jgi:hypothetical protein